MRKLKSTPKDYSPDMLPQNRWQVFWDVCKLQWRKLLIMGVLLLLSYIPALLIDLGKSFYAAGFFLLYQDAQENVRTQAATALMQAETVANLLRIPALCVFAITMAGTVRVLRQLAWGEYVYLPIDYKQGIKENRKTMIGLWAFMGFAYVLIHLLNNLSVIYESESLSLLALIPAAFSILFLIPICGFVLVMIPIYNNGIWQLFKMGAYAALGKLVKTIPMALLMALLWLPSQIPNFGWQLWGSVIVVILTPVTLLIWTLFTYNILDKTINPVFCPELIGRGIFAENHPKENEEGGNCV